MTTGLFPPRRPGRTEPSSRNRLVGHEKCAGPKSAYPALRVVGTLYLQRARKITPLPKLLSSVPSVTG